MTIRKNRKISEKIKRKVDIFIFTINILTIVPFTFLAVIFFQTFINIWYLVLIGLLFGSFVGVITYKKTKDYHNQSLRTIVTLSILFWGMLFNYVLLWANYNFRKHKEKTYDIAIVEFAKTNRRTASVLTIEFAGIVKDVHMPIEDYQILKEKGYLKVEIDKGLFGIYIILNMKVE